MIVNKQTIFRCDICTFESQWIKGKWIAHTFPVSKFWEHEFHLCSKECDTALMNKTKAQKRKVAMRVGGI